MAMKKFGLIGYPLTHSFSEKYFTEKFEKENINDYQYNLFSIEDINMLPKLLEKETALFGLNVTIPYKIEVMKYLDEIDKDAAGVGAVNCIKIETHSTVKELFSGELCTLCKEKKFLKGYNTDVYGFEESLKPLLERHHQKALILGNGGAAKAVQYVFDKLKIPFKLVSRSPKKGMLDYKKLNKKVLNEYQIIINTSPLGTYPNIDEYPNIPYEYLTEKHLLYDLVYNPAESAFLKKGKEKGAKIKNGYQMLELQAEKSWEIWNK
jgi:shikimate dehydrogenase